MGQIKIKPNKNGDSRVADHVPTFKEFTQANASHIDDVKNLMSEFSDKVRMTGYNHDWTKIREPHESMFYRSLCDTIEGKIKFNDCEWAKYHYEHERHHLNRNCPKDVNLVDVIEMICDCVVAGKARSGVVRDVEISDDILQKAVKNTVKMLDSWVIVEGEEHK